MAVNIETIRGILYILYFSRRLVCPAIVCPIVLPCCCFCWFLTSVCHIYLHEASHVFPVQEHQLQSHAKMLESFKVDLENQQQSTLDGKKAKARDMEEHLQYLQHEVRWTQDFISIYDYIN